MNRCYLSAVVCLAGFLAGCVSTQRPRLEPPHAAVVNVAEDNVLASYSRPVPSEYLQAIAFNVHLLPSVALPFAGKRSDADYRARKIAEQLTTYDLIGLSEAFDAAHRQTLVDLLQSESSSGYHVAYGPGQSGSHLIGSGLVLCSRYPILETHEITYENASRILTHGFKADSFAAKGALHATILLDPHTGRTMECFLTHLESQSESARRKQVREFSAFFAEHYHGTNPVIILGDFNIASEESTRSDSEYHDLRSQLAQVLPTEIADTGQHLAAGPPGSSDALADDGGRRIDYLFAANSDLPEAIKLVPRRTEHLRLLDEQVPEGSLSDHLAVACEFQLVPSPTASLPRRLPALGN